MSEEKEVLEIYIAGLKEIKEDSIKQLEKSLSVPVKLRKTDKIPERADLVIVDLTEKSEKVLFEIEKKGIYFVTVSKCDDDLIKRCLNRGAIDFFIKDENKNYLKIFPHYLKHLITHLEIIRKYEQERRIFSELSENAIFGIYVFGTDMKFRYLNPGLLKMLGHTLESIKDADVLSIIYYKDRNMVKEKMKERFEGKRKFAEYSFRVVDKDRNIKWVYARGFVTQISGEKVIMGTITDITELTKYQEEIKKEKEDLEKTLQGGVYAISRIVEIKDPYTANHQIRVAEIAEKIAKKFNFEEKKLKEILWAGLLHDVGKVAVPSEILTRTGKLNDIEYSLIRQHPVVGYRVIKEIHRMENIAKIIWQHHERLDGSGYPRGLRNDDIIFEARLLAVIDVIEAMSSHCPYRPARKKEEILEELIKWRGKKYDSIIVDNVIDLINKGEIDLTPQE